MRIAGSGFRARRRWGQHFLVNRGAITAILNAFDARSDDRVLEIGPGRGALTRHLAGAVRRVTAVEIDPVLTVALRRDLAGAVASGRLGIIEADAVEVDLGAVLDGLGATRRRPARMIANLPYNIATVVILRLLDHRDRLSDLLVMVQREVAERIVAAPGGRTYGGLSVLCQACATVDGVLRLRPGSFRPPPRVESQVIRLTPRRDGGALSLAALSALLRAAFAQRRKTLLNNLTDAVGREEAVRLLRDSGIGPGVRPEAVPVDGYLALLRLYRPPPPTAARRRRDRAL